MSTSAAAPAPMGSTAPLGKIRSPWAPIVLPIITLTVYYFVYQYKTFRELKDYSGNGLGGGLALLFAFLLGIVNTFVLPNEVGELYERQGQQRPVSWVTGLWNLIPIVGWIIYWFKVQGCLNEFWESKGATG
jgi:hypothetical protein